MLEITESGAIQVQLVTAMQPNSEQQTMFDWTLQIKNQNILAFDMVWSDPEAISTTGIDRDSLRIYLDDPSSIISCQASDGSALALRELED